MLSMFSFYGIPTYALGQGHAASMPTWMVALGGVQIRVHRDALEEARVLLAEVAERPLVTRRPLVDNPALNVVIVLFGLMFGAVPPTRVRSSYFLGERAAF